jgi:circadian clock protein KaiB
MHKVAFLSKQDPALTSATHQFRLYIAGESVNSKLALSNLKVFCEAYYKDDYHIEQIDVLLSPDIAWAQGVTATPMLLRLVPTSNLKIMGNLSDTEQLINGLGVLDG